MISDGRPQCPVHVCVPMRLERIAALVDEDGEPVRVRKGRHPRRTGLWRCRVPGCWRVKPLAHDQVLNLNDPRKRKRASPLGFAYWQWDEIMKRMK